MTRRGYTEVRLKHGQGETMMDIRQSMKTTAYSEMVGGETTGEFEIVHDGAGNWALFAGDAGLVTSYPWGDPVLVVAAEWDKSEEISEEEWGAALEALALEVEIMATRPRNEEWMGETWTEGEEVEINSAAVRDFLEDVGWAEEAEGKQDA